MAPKKTIIMGAAGRDFHNFNTVYRGNPDAEVVCFTATQIPDIEGVHIRQKPGEIILRAFPSMQKRTCLNSLRSTRSMK